LQIGALVAHTGLFWGRDILATFKNARKGIYNDRHHTHMVKHYKEAPWWWYALILVGSFVLGLVVVIKENITLPIWAYVVALVLGSIFAPLVSFRPPLTTCRRPLTAVGAEHDPLLSLRQRHRHEQPVQDAGWHSGPWASRG
jgi:hypothetical protein